MGTSYWCAAGVMMNDVGIFEIAGYDGVAMPIAGKCLENFRHPGWKFATDEEKHKTAMFIVNKKLKEKGIKDYD
jgi:hypothetical protein